MVGTNDLTKRSEREGREKGLWERVSVWRSFRVRGAKPDEESFTCFIIGIDCFCILVIMS